MLGTIGDEPSGVSVSRAKQCDEQMHAKKLPWILAIECFEALRKKKQGQLFFKDPEKARAHQHYSKLTTPIVDLGVPFTSVDDEPNLNDPQHHQNSASKFVSLADAMQDILIVRLSSLVGQQKRRIIDKHSICMP